MKKYHKQLMKNLYALIESTAEKNPVFKSKMVYWLYTRNRVPQTKWFFDRLVEIYGPHEVERKLLEGILRPRPGFILMVDKDEVEIFNNIFFNTNAMMKQYTTLGNPALTS